MQCSIYTTHPAFLNSFYGFPVFFVYFYLMCETRVVLFDTKLHIVVYIEIYFVHVSIFYKLFIFENTLKIISFLFESLFNKIL